MKNRREHDQSKKRASEEAMERTSQLTEARPSRDDTERREKRGREGLEREAARLANETGKDKAAAQRDLELEIQGRAYKVAFDTAPGAPFFRVEQLGGTKVLFINKASRFFQEVHSGPKSTPDVRAALELLLFAIGDRMLDTKDTQRDWYQFEVGEWSRKLEFALGQLKQQLASSSDDDDADDEAQGARGSPGRLSIALSGRPGPSYGHPQHLRIPHMKGTAS